jgi:beta-phosphoglucomutase-like phosphatase (HAD superfamily)
VYDYALDKLELPAEACLAIEDSLNGLRAAAAAGVASLVTVNRYTEQQDFTGALAVLDHLGEPDLPCTLLRGDCAPGGMVDVDFLVRLHQQTATA